MKNSWLLLTYKVPPDPSTRRIALWRKLKAMGAVYVQNSVCLLPKTEDHLRRLKVIENEIEEMGGDALLLETVSLDKTEHGKVVARFRTDRDEAYKEFIDKCADFEAEIARETKAKHFTYAELEENDEDLEKLKGWFAKIRKLDFHSAPLSTQADARLTHCVALLESYAKHVFEAHEENRGPGSEPATSSIRSRKPQSAKAKKSK
jgi:hypothetical protein